MLNRFCYYYWLAVVSDIFAIASFIVNVFGFWMAGNSLKVSANFPAAYWAKIQNKRCESSIPSTTRSGIREFVWISAEVENLWDTNDGERISPYLQGSRATLFHEYELPIIETYTKHITIVTEIEIDIAGTLCYFTSQVGQQVKTVDMILIRSPDGFIFFFSFSTISISPAMARKVGSQSWC